MYTYIRRVGAQLSAWASQNELAIAMKENREASLPSIMVMRVLQTGT